mmetsp:Transcript_16594/g.56065  ORF Transcript_16594/g.56065 Transcript_16594/m.56065 type:complete len:294 (-) Transcript_16594:103-984(-)
MPARASTARPHPRSGREPAARAVHRLLRVPRLLLRRASARRRWPSRAPRRLVGRRAAAPRRGLLILRRRLVTEPRPRARGPSRRAGGRGAPPRLNAHSKRARARKLGARSALRLAPEPHVKSRCLCLKQTSLLDLRRPKRAPRPAPSAKPSFPPKLCLQSPKRALQLRRRRPRVLFETFSRRKVAARRRLFRPSRARRPRRRCRARRRWRRLASRPRVAPRRPRSRAVPAPAPRVNVQPRFDGRAPSARRRLKPPAPLKPACLRARLPSRRHRAAGPRARCSGPAPLYLAVKH